MIKPNLVLQFLDFIWYLLEFFVQRPDNSLAQQLSTKHYRYHVTRVPTHQTYTAALTSTRLSTLSSNQSTSRPNLRFSCCAACSPSLSVKLPVTSFSNRCLNCCSTYSHIQTLPPVTYTEFSVKWLQPARQNSSRKVQDRSQPMVHTQETRLVL